jgi:eukaryotic-like serine/threonine-protein kinase
MSHADCSLLFGILALQNGLIDQADLIAAFQAWSKDRSRPLSQVLLYRGALNESDQALIEGLVRRHLQKHGEHPERSLADVPIAAAVCEELRQLADPDLKNLGCEVLAIAAHAARPHRSRLEFGVQPRQPAPGFRKP